MKPTWIIYGFRTLHHYRANGSTWTARAAIHPAEFLSEDAALKWVMDRALVEGVSNWEAVIVRLDHGRDRNGERHVTHRIGKGKAWWE